MQQETDLRNFNNSWYKPEGSGMRRGLWYLTNELVFKTGLFPINALKVGLLRAFGATIAPSVVIKPCVNIKYPWRLKIGANSWVGENVWIDNLDNVVIGPNCCLSQGAMLLCGSHNYKVPTFDLITKPITLGPGAWVGAQALVCPGVELGSHAVLAAGSVATNDIPAYSIAQGNPAVVKRERRIEN